MALLLAIDSPAPHLKSLALDWRLLRHIYVSVNALPPYQGRTIWYCVSELLDIGNTIKGVEREPTCTLCRSLLWKHALGPYS